MYVTPHLKIMRTGCFMSMIRFHPVLIAWSKWILDCYSPTEYNMKPLPKPCFCFCFWLSLLRGLRDIDFEPLHSWLYRNTAITQVSVRVSPSVKSFTKIKDSFQESGARYDKNPRPLPVKFAGPKLSKTLLSVFTFISSSLSKNK